MKALTEYQKNCFEEYFVHTDDTGLYFCKYNMYHLIGLELGMSVGNVGVRGEAGSRAQAPAVNDTEGRIDALARARVEKSGGVMTFAKAYETVLRDNPKLYTESLGL